MATEANLEFEDDTLQNETHQNDLEQPLLSVEERSEDDQAIQVEEDPPPSDEPTTTSRIRGTRRLWRSVPQRGSHRSVRRTFSGG